MCVYMYDVCMHVCMYVCTLLKMESCGYSFEELKWGVKNIGGYGNSSGVAQTLPRSYILHCILFVLYHCQW